MKKNLVARISGGAACLMLSALAAAESAPADELQKWITAQAVPVRAIDATDEDFRDLEPLIDAIGTARVVQLGEPMHGAGASFSAKARLVKFLHQRMGFDVVAWESGLYDVSLTQKALRAGDNPVSAAQAGVLMVWAASQEVKPLFEYAKASQSTSRPLEMAGFDTTINAAFASDLFAADLRAFAGALRDQALRTRAGELAEQILAAHQNLFARSETGRRVELESVNAAIEGRKLDKSPPEMMAEWAKSDAARRLGRKEDFEALDRATSALLAMTRDQRAAFLQAHGARHVSFMERAVDNLRNNDRRLYDRDRPDRPAADSPAASAAFNAEWNRRDALNVRNLRWLIEEGYPGRKIIVWAHNVHLMNAYYSAAVDKIHIEPQKGGLEPSGVGMAKWLGNEVYTIGMTSYEGEDGWGTSKPIATAPEGSLEWRLHRLGKPYLFLDLRVLDGSPRHPMRQPQSLRIDRYRDDRLTDVTRAFDAIFFIDRATGATRVRQ